MATTSAAPVALVSGSRLLVSFPGMLGTVLKPGTLNRVPPTLRAALKRTPDGSTLERRQQQQIDHRYPLPALLSGFRYWAAPLAC